STSPISRPGALHAACALGFGLHVVAFITDGLHVRLNVLPALFERHDVIAHRRELDQVQLEARPTQRLTLKQFLAQLLQLAASDPFCRRGLLLPRLLRMLGTPARTVTDQHATARMRTWTRGSNWHGNISKRSNQKEN